MMNVVNMLVKDAPEASASPKGAKTDATKGHGGFSRELDGVNGRHKRDAENDGATPARNEASAADAGADGNADEQSVSAENAAAASGETVVRKLAARALRLARDAADAAGAATAADKAAIAKAGKTENDAVAEAPVKGSPAHALRETKVAAVAGEQAVRHAQRLEADAKAVKAQGGESPLTANEQDATGEAAAAPDNPRANAALGDVLGILALSGGLVASGEKGASWRDAGRTESVDGAKTRAVDAHADVADGNDDHAETDAVSGEGESRLFRLQRGEGRGEAVDLKLSAGADGRVEAEAKVPGQARADTVSVLDARRYLGFDTPSNASSLTAAMAGEGDWAVAMQPGARLANEAQLSSTGQVVNTLKLQMTPGELGTVTATLRLAGDELSVHLTAHTAAAYRELKDDASAMLDALRAQGFSVDQVSVSMTSSSAQSQSGNDGNGQFSQQAAGEGRREDGRGAQQDGRRFAATQDNTGTAGGSDDTDMAGNSPRSSGGARPGHVYL